MTEGKQRTSGEESIVSMMEEKRVFPPPRELSEKAYIKSFDEYKQIYDRSVKDTESFWAEMGQGIGCRFRKRQTSVVFGR